MYLVLLEQPPIKRLCERDSAVGTEIVLKSVKTTEFVAERLADDRP